MRSTVLILLLFAAVLVAGCGPRCTKCQGADPATTDRVREALGLPAVATVQESGESARVRVALAIAEAEPVAAGGGCGTCLPEAEARAAARKAGVPMVLFVGGCSGRAHDMLAGTKAIAGRSDRYDHDKHDPTADRIVILTPEAGDGDVWRIAATLPADATAERVRAVLSQSVTQAAPVRIDWRAQAAPVRYAVPFRVSAPANCST